MTPIKPHQIRAIYGALRRIRASKEDIIHAATGGRTTSVREVAFEEAEYLIQELNKAVSASSEDMDAANKMRRKILSCCHEMNFPKQSGKLIMKHVHECVAKYGYLKTKGYTHLNAYKLSELPLLVVQFERMRESYLEKKTRQYLSNANTASTKKQTT